ncbi:ATP-binding protein [Alkalimonas sp. MEB108]|uniref:histidine kinase n=1 Tax=Alkalimonas cellulosilytica TaxID=3058395 RepID=A0ABU7J7J1_9GAMM|nr:ATP-binding protein [Alkalimonas sp. MEB108]MEE2002312.1 ATP-binding protein [Alkalimonas sp. MEB108]
MKPDESLLDKLHQLQIKNRELEQVHLLQTLILDGLHVILTIEDIDALFAQFFGLLRQALHFDAAVMTQLSKDQAQLLPVSCTEIDSDGALSIVQYIHQQGLERPLNAFHIPLLFKEPLLLASPWADMRSLLGIDIQTQYADYQLWIFSTERAAFGPQDLTLLQQFSSFAGSTISQVEKRRLHEQQKELQARQDQIEKVLISSEKMASLGQMAAGVAHEINNPLSYVLSNIQNLAYNHEQLHRLINALEQEVDPDKAQCILEQFRYQAICADTDDIMAEMTEGASRVKDIVKSLRQFSHPDQSKVDDIDLAELIDNTLRVAWNQIKYSAQVEKNYGNKSILVTARAAQLSQVLLNILVNAAQACDEKIGLIQITLCDDKDNAIIEIKDNGCGIPEDTLSKIFDPFFTTKAVGKGTGLGLAISKAIIEQHSGSIQVSSQPNEGTSFVITLPKQPDLSHGEADDYH